jgi:ankyrin repeat protein
MMLTEIGARAVREDWTELQTAAARGDVDMIEVLLAEDPGLLAKGDRAERPLLLAAMHGHQAAVEALVGAGADLDSPAGDAPLCFLAARGALEACRILLELGAEPAAECRNGRTPLHLAAKYSEAEVAQLLLEFDHPVNARDARGKTPLYWAAESTTTRMAEILLEAGADVNAVDGFGTTPLWHAREFGTADMARFLEEHGATVQRD